MGKLLDSLLNNAPADDVVKGTESSFRSGLRSGATSAGGSLSALAGNVGETLGADEFTASQYAKAAQAKALAEQQAPQIGSYKDVRGLRDAGSYVAGLAGQSLPYMAAGLGAGAVTALSGGGAVPAFLAATAATTPFAAGDTIQSQRQDPEIMKRSAGERLGTALVSGVGQSALENIVPMTMAGKMLGKGVSQGLRGGAMSTMAKNVGQGIVGEGATEGLQTAVQQQSLGYLNENRDTSGDMEQIKESVVGGAALGGLFGGAGGVGDIAHRRTSVGGPSLLDRAREGAGALATRAGEALTAGKEKAGVMLNEARDPETGLGAQVSAFADSVKSGDMTVA